MNLERFPSGKFSTNELVLELAMPAYNILRMIGDESIGPGHPMRHPVKRRRIGTVIKNLVMIRAMTSRSEKSTFTSHMLTSTSVGKRYCPFLSILRSGVLFHHQAQSPQGKQGKLAAESEGRMPGYRQL